MVSSTRWLRRSAAGALTTFALAVASGLAPEVLEGQADFTEDFELFVAVTDAPTAAHGEDR